jgi:hypothetical protein
MTGRRPLPGAVDLLPGARLTPDEFAALVLRPAAALSTDSPTPEEQDGGAGE